MSELAATPTWRADTKRLLEASATAWSCFEPAADGSSGIQNPTERLFNDTVSWFGRRSTAVWATILLDFLPCAGGDGMGEGGGRGNGAESGGEDGGEASRDGSISELQSCAGGLSCSSSPISIRARLGCTFVPIGVPQDERQGLAVLTPTDSVRAAVPESAARNETLTNPRLAAVCWPSLRPFTSGELRCALPLPPAEHQGVAVTQRRPLPRVALSRPLSPERLRGQIDHYPPNAMSPILARDARDSRGSGNRCQPLCCARRHCHRRSTCQM